MPDDTENMDYAEEYREDDLYFRGLTTPLHYLSPHVDLKSTLKRPQAYYSRPKQADAEPLMLMRSFANTLVRTNEIISILPRISVNGHMGLMMVDMQED